MWLAFIGVSDSSTDKIFQMTILFYCASELIMSPLHGCNIAIKGYVLTINVQAFNIFCRDIAYDLQIWAVERIYIVEKLIAFIVKMAISFNSTVEIMIEIDNKYRT